LGVALNKKIGCSLDALLKESCILSIISVFTSFDNLVNLKVILKKITILNPQSLNFKNNFLNRVISSQSNRLNITYNSKTFQ
jgi:hypothetical protein